MINSPSNLESDRKGNFGTWSFLGAPEVETDTFDKKVGFPGRPQHGHFLPRPDFESGIVRQTVGFQP